MLVWHPITEVYHDMLQADRRDGQARQLMAYSGLTVEDDR